MKKILALILALVLVAAVSAAGAATLDYTPGTPASCTFELFKTYFDLMTATAGYTFNWDEDSSKEGDYDVHYAVTEDGAMFVITYCEGGNVLYVKGEGTLVMTAGDNSAAEKFGQWFGATISGGVLGLYIGEEGPAAATTEATETFQSELKPLLATLQDGLTSEEELMNGVASTVTVLGYPTGLAVDGSISGTTITLNMTILVSAKDGTLGIK